MDKICAATDMDITSAIRHDEQDDRNNNGYDKASGDLYACMRPILILGRVLGILPISGVFMGPDVNDDKVLTYHLGFGYVFGSEISRIKKKLLISWNFQVGYISRFVQPGCPPTPWGQYGPQLFKSVSTIRRRGGRRKREPVGDCCQRSNVLSHELSRVNAYVINLH